MMLVENLPDGAAWVFDQCGEASAFAERKYLTIAEVADAAQMSGQGRLSANVVREGLKAAGCHNHAQVRAGRGRMSVWFGPGMDQAERDVAKGLKPAEIGRQAQKEREAAAAVAEAVG